MIKFQGGTRNVKTMGNYVYIHYRADNLKPFYVGKGKSFRAWHSGVNSRNKWWRFVALKHGVKVEICQDSLSEEDANLLEMWLIAKLRWSGEKLCNITDGGEGRIGHVSNRRKLVYCSNGMSFPSTEHASLWLRENGHPKATSKNISAACMGQKTIVHGLCWSYERRPDAIDTNGKSAKTRNSGLANRRKVYCSNGMVFDSLSDASFFAVGNRKNGSRIGACCRGERGSVMGLTWSFEEGGCRPFVDPMVGSNKAKLVPVECSNGMKFGSYLEAIEWGKSNGLKISHTAISRAVKTGGKAANLRWRKME